MIEFYEPAEWLANGYDAGALDTYRLYLLSDDPSDRLQAVYGNAAYPLRIDTSPGFATFVNTLDSFGNGSLTAPVNQTPIHWENQWDTYVTIDTDTADGDATQLSPTFGNLVNDLETGFTLTNGSWYVTDADAPQGEFDGGMVLIAKFTVDEGTLMTGWVNAQIFGGTQFTFLQFDNLPAPGAIAVLGVAGLVGRRWRRN